MGYNHVPVLSDGSLLLSVSTESSDYPNLCSGPSVRGTGFDVAITALSAEGELMWSKVQGGDGNDLAVTIDRAPDEHVWFVGWTDSENARRHLLACLASEVDRDRTATFGWSFLISGLSVITDNRSASMMLVEHGSSLPPSAEEGL